MVQSLKNMIKKLMFDDNRKKWKPLLAEATHLLNKTYSSAIGISPFEANFGFVSRSPLDNMIRKRKELKDDMVKHLLKAKKRMKSNYDRNKKQRVLSCGDLVFVINNAKKVWSDPGWLGPYKIIFVMENDNYVVLIGNNPKRFNISQIKLAGVDGSPADIQKPIVENRDVIYTVNAT